jgi:hypothetical protein
MLTIDRAAPSPFKLVALRLQADARGVPAETES